MADSDAGRLDGDPLWDRAVGPMQFIPSTWSVCGSDGDSDGEADPQDIDDAALSAARNPCASGAQLTPDSGWRRAILSYNNSVDYVRLVHDAADSYARRSTAD